MPLELRLTLHDLMPVEVSQAAWKNRAALLMLLAWFISNVHNATQTCETPPHGKFQGRADHSPQELGKWRLGSLQIVGGSMSSVTRKACKRVTFFDEIPDKCELM